MLNASEKGRCLGNVKARLELDVAICGTLAAVTSATVEQYAIAEHHNNNTHKQIYTQTHIVVFCKTCDLQPHLEAAINNE